jgi:signal transduction histidine kinase
MKIRLKLTLWFTALVALIVGMGAFWGWLGLRATVYYQAEQEVHDKRKEVQLFIATVSQEFRQQKLNFDLRENARNLDQIFANDQTSRYDNIFIQLTDTQGNIISRSSNLGKLLLPIHPQNNNQSDFHQLELQHEKDKVISILYTSSPIIVYGQVRGYLQLGLSMVKSKGFLDKMLLFEALALIFSMGLSLVLGQLLAQRALTPMLKITQQVQEMAGQDLFKPLDTSALSRDEIGILAETFNGLMQRIEKVFVAQQHFLSDASHEFKTPLTAIRGHAQLLQKRGTAHPEIVSKSSATIIRECTRLARLIEDLLLLARLEGHAEKLENLNMVQLLEEIFEDLSPLHPQLKLIVPSAVLKIQGHSDSLYRVFLNLLDNAFKSTLTGDVVISCQSQQNEVEIKISDQGTGIAAEHLPHLFERFYRVDSDRNRKSGGSGIGLALVSEVIKFHQGSISVISKEGFGTTFSLRFPLV